MSNRKKSSLKEISHTSKAILNTYKYFFYWLFRRPFNFRQIIEQFMRTLLEGVTTIVVGAIVMGMFIAWIGGYFGSLYSAKTFIGPSAFFLIIREFSLLLVGLLYACRIGTAFTVEIGSMAMNGQLDAQRMMAVEPYQYIIIPRTLGSVLSILFLLAITHGVAIIASTFFLESWFSISYKTIFENAFFLIKPGTVIQSFVRAAIIGFFIAQNACAIGFYFNGGAVELGKAATKSIVINFIYVMVIDFITAILVTYSRWLMDTL